jgi:endonuclease-3 related protein
VNNKLLRVYSILDSKYGPLNWWPGESPLEVMVGAILTQNTAWSNVEKAITLLKSNNLLSLKALREIDLPTLEECIRPSGFFKQKSERIKRLVGLIDVRFGGSIKKMAQAPLSVLRKTLLQTNGIGPETADSMLLYALEKPVFVVDAYTRRIFGRLSIISGSEPYEEIRALFESNLPAKTYNQYHALIVQTAKDFCKKRNPLCSECPLKRLKQCRPSLFS